MRDLAELDVRERDRRRAYLETHVFELLIAVMATLSALAFFLAPAELARSAVGRAVHPFDTAWNVLYLAGGALIVAGLARSSHRLEVAGLLFLSSAIAGAAFAVAIVVGLSGAASVAIYAAAAGACIVRISVIRRLERAVASADAELVAMQPDRRR